MGFYNEEALNEFVTERVNYNSLNIGTISYDIYKKAADGSLVFLANTSDTTYTTTIDASSTTFVVKTTYSIFKNNASVGTETTIMIDESIITSQINGENNIQLFINTPYTEPEKPVIVLENMFDVTDQATITTTIEGPNTTIDTSIIGTYKINYHVSYKGYTEVLVKTIEIKNS